MFRRQRTSGIIVCLMGLSCLGLGVLASTPASAQVSGATITGTVSDPVGAVIPRAQVSIRNLATGEERSVSTDTAGLYTLPNLSPSKYQVTVTALGFSTKVLSGVTLTVGAQQLLNVTMDVGQISQKVEVSSEAPTVQLASSDISGVVGESAVVDLPLNGRDWTSLAISESLPSVALPERLLTMPTDPTTTPTAATEANAHTARFAFLRVAFA